MIASLKDPYSRFLTPDQFARLAKYDITGVGLNIGDVLAEGVEAASCGGGDCPRLASIQGRNQARG